MPSLADCLYESTNLVGGCQLILWMSTTTRRSFSLRSSESGIDVAEVAKKYAGGGHKKAAGFTVDIGWEGD